MELELIEIAKQVNEELGPGFSESVYHQAFLLFLRKQNIPYESERILPITLYNHVIGSFRCDVIVNNKIVVEFKSIESRLRQCDINQVHNYLRFLPDSVNQGLLINFGKTNFEYRIILKHSDEE